MYIKTKYCDTQQLLTNIYQYRNIQSTSLFTFNCRNKYTSKVKGLLCGIQVLVVMIYIIPPIQLNVVASFIYNLFFARVIGNLCVFFSIFM